MRYLLIETSTERGAIALVNGQSQLFAKELPLGLTQSKYLMKQLVDALKPFGPSHNLDAIGVGIGPGSYTGIRIGVAVAQALAFSWKVPLVGVSSLYGFHPETTYGPFAAMIDARIGGFYLLEGRREETGLSYPGEPVLCSLEEAGAKLACLSYCVTPLAKSLAAKLKQQYPGHSWVWEERSPSVSALLGQVDSLFRAGKVVFPPQQLDILYLRLTEAERARENSPLSSKWKEEKIYLGQ